jgi:hypothetical protein
MGGGHLFQRVVKINKQKEIQNLIGEALDHLETIRAGIEEAMLDNEGSWGEEHIALHCAEDALDVALVLIDG